MKQYWVYHSLREVEAWGQTLASLVVLLEYIDEVLLPRCEDGNLLSGTDSSPDELMTMLNSVPQYSFYGRCLGFHASIFGSSHYMLIKSCAFK